MPKIVTFGQFEDYIGMRGYQKQHADIFVSDTSDPEKKMNIGICKVEPVLDHEGKVLTNVFYARYTHNVSSKINPKGQPWQFASRRALAKFIELKLADVPASNIGGAAEKSSNYVEEMDALDAFGGIKPLLPGQTTQDEPADSEA